MKLLALVPVLFLFSSLSAQTNPFKTLQYTKVVAYEFQGNGHKTIDRILSEFPFLLDNSKVLNESEVHEFNSIITPLGTYGETTAACFDPHFAIIYYKGEEVVAQVDVCLECNYLLSSVDIPAEKEVILDEGTEYERPAIGFAKDTRKLLNQFILELGFEKYKMTEGSIFD